MSPGFKFILLFTIFVRKTILQNLSNIVVCKMYPTCFYKIIFETFFCSNFVKQFCNIFFKPLFQVLQVIFAIYC